MKTEFNKIKIEELIKSLKFGEETPIYNIQIPIFQRDYVWSLNKDGSDLMDSLLQNYPIGSLTFSTLNNKEDNYLLIDGLQRSFTILEISKRPWKYISNKIIRKFFNLYSSDEKFKKIETDSDRRDDHALYDYLTRKIRSIREKNTIEELSEYLKSIKDTGDNDKTKKRNNSIVSLVNDILIWSGVIEDSAEIKFCKKSEEFLNKSIPYIKIENSTNENISEIFSLINNKGRKLSIFESNASHWSVNKIELQKISNHKYIDIIENRSSNYCKNVVESETSSEFSLCKKNLRYKDKGYIYPSDLAYSFLNLLVDDKSLLRFQELLTNSNKELKDMDKMIYLIMNTFNWETAKDNKWSYEHFGEYFSHIVNSGGIEVLFKDLKDAFVNFKNNFEIFNYIGASKKAKDLTSSVSLSNTFIIFGINHFYKIQKSELNKIKKNTLLLRFIQTKLDNKRSLGSSSAKNAIKALEKKEWIKPLEVEEKELLKELVHSKILKVSRNKNEIKKDFDRIDKILAWQTTQKIKDGLNYQYDHVIPRNIYKKITEYQDDAELMNYMNSVYNIQLLEEGDNIKKSGEIHPEKFNYDTIVHEQNFKSEKKYKDLLKKISNYKNLDLIDDNKKRKKQILDIRNSILKILKLREEIIKPKIEKLFE